MQMQSWIYACTSVYKQMYTCLKMCTKILIIPSSIDGVGVATNIVPVDIL